MKNLSALAVVLATFILNGEGAYAMPNKVDLSSLQGEQANTAGEYYMHLRTSVALLNFAAQQNVVDEDAFNTFVQDFRNAQNAWEVMQTQHALTRLLYREAVDYSDILYESGVIDFENYLVLKSNIARRQ